MNLEKWRSAGQIPGIMFGTALYAFGIHFFILPNEFMEGGITGIGILLNYAFGWQLSITTLLLNIPLFLLGWKLLSRRDMALTIFGTLSLSFFLFVMEQLLRQGWITPFITKDDLILAALYAGLTVGAGLGIVFRFGGTTGGSDILGRVLNRWKGWSMGQFFLYFDAAVIALSIFYISMERILYTLVVVYISAKTIDVIQQGEYAARAFAIISDKREEIAKQIMGELDRGVTIVPARGAFTGKERDIIYCVVYRHETRRLERLVRRVDPRAFMIVNEVKDVLGEGFKSD